MKLKNYFLNPGVPSPVYIYIIENQEYQRSNVFYTDLSLVLHNTQCLKFVKIILTGPAEF